MGKHVALVDRPPREQRIAPKLQPDRAKPWEVDRRWAGPCTRLRAVFYSKAVEDADPKNVVDLYELRYGTEDEARRVARLFVSSWDWNYHPFIAVPSGASVVCNGPGRPPSSPSTASCPCAGRCGR